MLTLVYGVNDDLNAGGWTALKSWAQGGRVSIKLKLVNISIIMLKLVDGVNDYLKKVESMARMDGQVVVITGANTGIGFDLLYILINKSFLQKQWTNRKVKVKKKQEKEHD